MEIVNIEENKNNLVVKHQELVHIARYRLSELGIKVVSVLISMIKVKDIDFQEYALKLNDFKELIGSTSNKTYEYVDIMTDELMKKPFKIGDEKFNWIYYARYHKGDNYVILKIAPELKPYLLALSSNFLKYNIANILPLRSAYVIRLYELCKDHHTERTRYKPKASVIFDIKIDKLREQFVVPDSYRYNDIRRHIIDKAVKQFKEKTDIQISYTEQKIGRKVDRIIITVKENNKGSNHCLNSKKSFIEYIREKYKPNVDEGIYPTIIKTIDGKIKVDLNGKLYLSSNSQNKNIDYDHTKADKIWHWLYTEVKNGNIKNI